MNRNRKMDKLGENPEDENVTVKSEEIIKGIDFVREEKQYDIDKSEEKTVSYAEYERNRRKAEEGRTVELSKVGLIQGKFNPVEIARSEPNENQYGNLCKEFEEEYQSNEKFMEQGIIPALKAQEHSIRNNEFVRPAGWLVCIKGPDYGRCFCLKEGKNRIGRSEDMDVVLKNDEEITRQCHICIEYIDDTRSFKAFPGEIRKIIYINDDLMLVPREIKRNDIISIGVTDLMLIPCCDEKFSWSGNKE